MDGEGKRGNGTKVPTMKKTQGLSTGNRA